MQLLSLLKELSLHPKNAEELKGLILQLAIQGKTMFFLAWQKERTLRICLKQLKNILIKILNHLLEVMLEDIVMMKKHSNVLLRIYLLFVMVQEVDWCLMGEMVL